MWCKIYNWVKKKGTVEDICQIKENADDIGGKEKKWMRG